ncbi:MAG: acyl-CoA thioesterase [Legionellales bacterium]|nr:acyl-CoA thioesterase [Legionellales bacterium]HAG62133.1 acyl-CoA thioesterase [Coxiellaceae bacterium]
MSEVMTPNQANFAGNIHGGQLLSFLDKVAYACAARYSGRYVVTLSVDQVVFKHPVHVGNLLTCLASINHVGNSSMEIGIKVIAEDLTTGTVTHTNSCFFTMIALDDNHKPVTINPLICKTDEQKRRFKEAELRKKMRIELAEKEKNILKK